MTDTLDPEYARIAQAVRQAGFDSADPTAIPLEQARDAQERYFAYLAGELPEVAEIHDRALDGPRGAFRVRIVLPRADGPLPLIVFVRGAGWWAGSMDSHARTMHLLARKSGFAVCGVDYHRAPEARFPTQLDELLTAIRWLRSDGAAFGVDASRMILAGESAGATLCLLGAIRMREQRIDSPSGLVLFYGNFCGPSLQSRPYSRWVWANYLGSDTIPADPAAVPATMDLSALPPAWLGVGGADPLAADSVAVARKLADANVPVTLKRYPGLPHAFVMMSRLFPGADQALSEAAAAANEFVARQIAMKTSSVVEI